MTDLLAVLDEAACWCGREHAECAEAGGCRWTRQIADLEHDAAVHRLRADQLQKELDTQVSGWREKIMRDTVRRYETGRADSTWMVATRHIPGPGADQGLLHHRDPASPPRIEPPTTTVRPRYLNGDQREAGPGSHIGIALCGLPLMAEELWVRADHIIRAAANNPDPGCRPDLCGMCSYLAGQPTIEAAWEALNQ